MDLAIAPGIWLMPSNLVINTESIVGYNNELQKASFDMRFGVNVGVNEKSKTVGIKHNLGDSKVKLPHVVDKKVEPVVSKVVNKRMTRTSLETVSETEDVHETNKTIYMIAAVGLGWWLFR